MAHLSLEQRVQLLERRQAAFEELSASALKVLVRQVKRLPDAHLRIEQIMCGHFENLAARKIGRPPVEARGLDLAVWSSVYEAAVGLACAFREDGPKGERAH